MPFPSIGNANPAVPDLRSFSLSKVQLVAVLIFALAALPACSEKKPYIKETFVMGTKAWIKIYGLRANEAEVAAGDALRELHRIESVMSTWKEKSEISRLNRESAGTPRTVSAELITLVRSAFQYSELTDGAFDITARPLVRLWGFQGGTARVPSDHEIKETLKHVGYQKVTVDTAASTVTLPAGMELDLAGIAKGYGVDRCIHILKKRGVKSALVNLGGNMYALGAPPGKPSWTIGIRDPRGGNGIVGSILLKDEAVATSGNYENLVEIDGKRYGHIIDPHTGRPVEHVLSVTVTAPTALASDALSTGMFVLGPNQVREILKKLGNVRLICAFETAAGLRYETYGDYGGALLLEDIRTGGN